MVALTVRVPLTFQRELSCQHLRQMMYGSLARAVTKLDTSAQTEHRWYRDEPRGGLT